MARKPHRKAVAAVSAAPAPKRAGPGRPAHRPTPEGRRNVATLAGFGITEDDIALVLEIDPKTLRKHYALEIRTGRVKANAQVAGALFKAATGGGKQAVSAGIWWSKTQMGWSDKSRLELTGKDGGPVETRSLADLEKMTDAELLAIAAGHI